MGGTVKVSALLETPLTVTRTGPVVVPAGTGTTILVFPQAVGAAGTLLNVTVLDPCVAPKLDPLIVTEVPTGPAAGERLVIPGETVNGNRLLASPLTVTTMGPAVAAEGTCTRIVVAPQLVGVTVTPPRATVLVP